MFPGEISLYTVKTSYMTTVQGSSSILENNILESAKMGMVLGLTICIVLYGIFF